MTGPCSTNLRECTASAPSREQWKCLRGRAGPRKLVLIDETCVKTGMALLRGWALKGESPSSGGDRLSKVPPFRDVFQCSFVDSKARAGDAVRGAGREDSPGPFSRGPFDQGDQPGLGSVACDGPEGFAFGRDGVRV